MGIKRTNGFSRPWTYYQLIVAILDLLLTFTFYVLIILLLDGLKFILLISIESVLFILEIKLYYNIERINPEWIITKPNQHDKPDLLNEKTITCSKNTSTDTKILYCIDVKHKQSQKPQYCRECGKSIQGLDHHCVWLNTCIGAKNYESFILLLIVSNSKYLLQVVFGIFIQTIWLYKSDKTRIHDSFPKSTYTAYFVGVSLYTLLSVVFLAGVACLVSFHCYLIFIKKTTTFDWMMQRRGRARSPSSSERKKNDADKSEAKKLQMQQQWQNSLLQRHASHGKQSLLLLNNQAKPLSNVGLRTRQSSTDMLLLKDTDIESLGKNIATNNYQHLDLMADGSKIMLPDQLLNDKHLTNHSSLSKDSHQPLPDLESIQEALNQRNTLDSERVDSNRSSPKISPRIITQIHPTPLYYPPAAGSYTASLSIQNLYSADLYHTYEQDDSDKNNRNNHRNYDYDDNMVTMIHNPERSFRDRRDDINSSEKPNSDNTPSNHNTEPGLLQSIYRHLRNGSRIATSVVTGNHPSHGENNSSSYLSFSKISNNVSGRELSGRSRRSNNSQSESYFSRRMSNISGRFPVGMSAISRHTSNIDPDSMYSVVGMKDSKREELETSISTRKSFYENPQDIEVNNENSKEM